MNPYLLPDGPVQIAFSGGRSSAYMLHQILEANGPLPDRVLITFQNTGREMEETLDFVREAGDRWSVPIVWLEYCVLEGNKVGFKVVDHASAARNGEPFEALIRKRKYLPNQAARFCTIELKVRTAKRYMMQVLGWKHWTNAVGFRADEMRRVNKPPPRDRWTVWAPMAAAGAVKEDVTAFWSRQPFDLRLANNNGKTPYGNCDGCFLKAEATVARLGVDHPERAAWWEDMERLGSELTSGTGATFSKRYSRKQIRIHLENQDSLDFSETGVLCQADDGECFG